MVYKKKRKRKKISVSSYLALVCILSLFKFIFLGGEFLGFTYKGLYPDISSDIELVKKDISEELTPNNSDSQIYTKSGLELPVYDGTNQVVEVNNNVPFFTVEERNSIHTTHHFTYSPLDFYGRAGVATATITPSDLISSEGRRGIDLPEPTGWVGRKDGGVYDRSHLVAYTFSGSNELDNLITGTIALNQKYMVEVENDTRSYIMNSGHSVLYRVTPYFVGAEKVSRGVLMEVLSDDGSFSRCVFIHNVQQGFSIDYSSGKVN